MIDSNFSKGYSMKRRDIKHIQKLIDTMKKPNLDDYDNGHVDEPISLRFPLTIEETKSQRAERRMQFFLDIWRERKNADGHRYSEVSGKRLPDRFSSLCIDHLIPRAKHSELEFEPENIALMTPEEHQLKENGNPLPKHKELIEEAKKRFGIV